MDPIISFTSSPKKNKQPKPSSDEGVDAVQAEKQAIIDEQLRTTRDYCRAYERTKRLAKLRLQTINYLTAELSREQLRNAKLDPNGLSGSGTINY
jgi:hypothetical protein